MRGQLNVEVTVAGPWKQTKTERDFKQQPTIKDTQRIVYLPVCFVAMGFMALIKTFACLHIDTTVNKALDS